MVYSCSEDAKGQGVLVGRKRLGTAPPEVLGLQVLPDGDPSSVGGTLMEWKGLGYRGPQICAPLPDLRISTYSQDKTPFVSLSPEIMT